MNERKPLRLYSHNYSDQNSYFITIKLNCDLRFGEIIDNKIQLNELGNIAKKCWNDIPRHFNFCTLDEYVIMPDHIHGIIKIISLNDVGDRYICPPKENDFNNNDRYICPQKENDFNNSDRYIFPPKENDFNNNDKNIHPHTDADVKRHVQLLPKAIGCFKAAVSRMSHKKGYLEFKWQRSYNDRIIRKTEYKRLRIYIKNNPAKWKDDEIV